MENDITTLLTQNEYSGSLPPKKDHFEVPSSTLYQKSKRVCKRKAPVRKTKAEAAKIEEEIDGNCSTIDDLSADQAFDCNPSNMNNFSNSSSQDENLILHLVLSKILDKKKTELLNRASVRHSLMKRRHYHPAKE